MVDTMLSEQWRDLRTRAEAELHVRAHEAGDHVKDLSEMVYELELHKIELELQNEELRSSQRETELLDEKYRDLFERAPVGYAQFSPDGVFVEVNIAAGQMLQRARAELLGKRLSDFVVSEDCLVLDLHRKGVVYSGARENCELRLRCGTIIRLESIRTDAVTRQWRAAFLDITDARKMRDALTRAHKLELVGTLTASVAHDFNNLLMGVGGCAELALSRLESGHHARRPLEELRLAIHRASSVVDRLLQTSRHDPQTVDVVNLNTLISESELLLQKVLGESIWLRLELQAPEAAILADAGKVQEILLNLAVNAKHSMPNGGKLRIRTLRAPNSDDGGSESQLERVCISIEDTGCGMDERTLGRVLEPFFTTRTRGLGLGLSNVNELVTSAGGELGMQSLKGQGTTVTILFPLASPTRIALAASKVEERKIAARIANTVFPNGGSALIVDDEPLVRLAVRHQLESLGLFVVEAESAEEALRLVAQAPNIRLVVSDVILPGMSGSRLREVLAVTHPQIGMVLMSAYPQENVRGHFGLPEACVLLKKPFQAGELLRVVEALCAPQSAANDTHAEETTVLVIEDESATRYACSKLLEEDGFNVVAASTANVALTRALECNALAVAVCDVRLPDMGAAELIQRLRATRPDLPVVLTSGLPENAEELTQLRQLRNTRFLPKPFDISNLVAEIRALRIAAGSESSDNSQS